MNEEEELSKLKWLAIALIGFLVSGYYSYRELKYAVWGMTTTATVNRTFEKTERGRRGRTTRSIVVEYTYNDSRTGQRNERDNVAIDWPVTSGTVEVQYLPGVADSSRLKGHSSTISVWIFLACIGGLAFAWYQFHKLAHEHDAPKRKRRKK